MVKVECFFDCASPWSYIGFSNLLGMTARLGIAADWRPVVVGFVFGQVNQEIYLNRRLLSPPLKGAYEGKELQGVIAGTYKVLVQPPRGATKDVANPRLPIQRKYLDFDKSGLTVTVPVSGEVVLEVER